MWSHALRLAVRRARASSAWWSTVVLLGLSTAATVTALVVYDRVVRHPLPVAGAERILTLGGLAYGDGLPNAVEWWEQADGLQHLSLYASGDAEITAEGWSPRWKRLTEVSGDFFRIFHGQIVEGRELTRHDEGARAEVAVVSERLWADVSRGRPLDARVSLTVGGVNVVIVGVVSGRFGFPSESEVWMPRARQERLRPMTVDGVSGLPPLRTRVGWVAVPDAGVTPSDVKAQLKALLTVTNDTLTQKTGMRYGNAVSATTLVSGLTSAVRTPLTAVLVATTVVFALCLVNLIVLSLAHQVDRQGERALRLGLGAARRHLIAELASSALLLTAGVWTAGALASAGFLQLARRSLHAYRVYLPSDGSVWWWVAGLSLAAAAGIAAVQAVTMWMASRRTNLAALMQPAFRSAGGTRGVVMARRCFVALAAATSTALVAGAVVADGALLSLVNADLGYDSHQRVAARVSVVRHTVGGAAFGSVRARLRDAATQAGLSDVAVAGPLPIRSAERRFQEVTTPSRRMMASVTEIDGPYFATMGLRLEGRPIDAAHEVVINRSLAAAIGADGIALGGVVGLGGVEEPVMVVGIVDDVRTVDQDAAPVFELYRAFAAIDGTAMPMGSVSVDLYGQCSRSCQDLTAGLIAHLVEVPTAAVVRVVTLDALIGRARGAELVAASIWSTYGLLSIGIATMGIIAMVTYTVRRRRTETGVRLALGGPSSRVAFGLARESVLATCVGSVAGVMLFHYGAAALSAWLPGLGAPSIYVLVLSAVGIAIVGSLSALVPAWRGSRRNAGFLLRAGD